MAKMILMEDPHEFYKLIPNVELVVFLYALSTETINGAMYGPLKDLLDDSPFFKANYDYNRHQYRHKISINIGSTISKNVGKNIFLVWMDRPR